MMKRTLAALLVCGGCGGSMSTGDVDADLPTRSDMAMPSPTPDLTVMQDLSMAEPDLSTVDAAMGPKPPTAAAAVGYDVLTFNSTTLGTTAGTWQNFGFYGTKQPADVASQGSDGSLLLSGHQGTDGALATATVNLAKPEKFQGMAFGGGGYFEATLSFPTTPTGDDKSPTFWALDVEHSSTYLPETNGDMSIEIDDFETDIASDTKWGQSLHNWYNNGGAHNIAANPPAILAGNPVSVPNGGNFSQSHTYAYLWVPATTSTQGYLKFFCDGVQIGGEAKWNKYSATQPFPPSGDNIGNYIDEIHLYLILSDASTATPAKVTSVRVWQASAAHNLSY